MTEVEWLDVFSDNLVSMMREHDITQRELAYETGLSESAISNYIHRRQIPCLKAIINIAHFLDCSIDELIDFDEDIN